MPLVRRIFTVDLVSLIYDRIANNRHQLPSFILHPSMFVAESRMTESRTTGFAGCAFFFLTTAISNQHVDLAVLLHHSSYFPHLFIHRA